MTAVTLGQADETGLEGFCIPRTFCGRAAGHARLEAGHASLDKTRSARWPIEVRLTPDDVGDVSEVPDLLDQIDADIASMTADGAYDGEAVYDAVAERHPSATVITPPRVTSVADETKATQRDRHLAMIDEHGRMAWQRRAGYNRRSLVETAMFRYKTIIGRKLQARTLSNQKTEAKIGCNVLNRMTGLGMPASARVR